MYGWPLLKDGRFDGVLFPTIPYTCTANVLYTVIVAVVTLLSQAGVSTDARPGGKDDSTSL